MTSDDYFRGASGRRYTYAELADRIRKEAPHTLGKHIYEQLEAIGLLNEMMSGTTPCGLPLTFAEAEHTSPPAAAESLPTPFDVYEIHGVREFDDGAGKYCEQVPDEEAQFWSLFGHIPGQGLDCIGDFRTREHAEEVYARITGRPYGSRP